MALLCLGEVGRRADLSQAAGVEAAVIAALSADSEDVKAAASLALGGVTYGCLGTALPSLLASISGATGNAKPVPYTHLTLPYNRVVVSLLGLVPFKPLNFFMRQRLTTF